MFWCLEHTCSQQKIHIYFVFNILFSSLECIGLYCYIKDLLSPLLALALCKLITYHKWYFCQHHTDYHEITLFSTRDPVRTSRKPGYVSVPQQITLNLSRPKNIQSSFGFVQLMLQANLEFRGIMDQTKTGSDSEHCRYPDSYPTNKIEFTTLNIYRRKKSD